jgi:adenylate cyclase class 2
MTYEVEQKFRVADPSRLLAKLKTLGLELPEAFEQTDRYYNHPSRDFARTDEALRIRSVGRHNRITYKGPKLDAVTKTRQEIELPVADGIDSAAALSEILTNMGFTPVRTVRKCRSSGTLHWQGSEVEVSLDVVEPLGTFVELELTTGQNGLEKAQRIVQSLASELGLSAGERRSYLELLLDADSG